MRRALGALLGALLLLSGTSAYAQAAGPSFSLTWQYTPDTVSPATKIIVQRCIQLSTGCTMTDLAGASALPIDVFTYTDVQVILGVQYCFRLAGANAYGRSAYSSTVCGTIGTPPSSVPQNVQLKINLPTP